MGTTGGAPTSLESLSGWRLFALVVGLLGAGFVGLGAPVTWVRVHTLIGAEDSIAGIGFDLQPGRAAGLPTAWTGAVLALGGVIALCTLVTLLPSYRLAAIGAIVAGATAALVGGSVLIALRVGSQFSGQAGHSDIEPGSGPYLVACGGALGVVAGIVVLCTPRLGRASYKAEPSNAL